MQCRCNKQVFEYSSLCVHKTSCLSWISADYFAWINQAKTVHIQYNPAYILERLAPRSSWSPRRNVLRANDTPMRSCGPDQADSQHYRHQLLWYDPLPNCKYILKRCKEIWWWNSNTQTVWVHVSSLKYFLWFVICRWTLGLPKADATTITKKRWLSLTVSTR